MQRPFPISPAIVCSFALSCLVVEAAAPRPAWVIPSVLNVRQDRGTDSPKVGALRCGTKVYVTAFNDLWCRISYDGGKRGWVSESLLQFSAAEGRKLAAEAEGRAAQSSVNPPAWVKVDSARLRTGAGTGYRQITSVEQGAKVHTIGASGSWRRVKLSSGTTGWMRSDLLETNVARGQKLTGAAPEAAPTSRPPKAFINGDNVNVREEPNARSRPVDQLARGTTVWLIETREGWQKVKYADGDGGWIASALLKPADSSTVLSAQTAAAQAQPAAQPEPPLPAEPPLESMYGWVAETTAKLRYGPGMQFDVKSEVSEGTKVTVLDVEGHWCKLRTGPQEYGWMAAWCIDFLGRDNQVFVDGSDKAVQVHVGWATGSGTSLREGPAVEHKRVATIPRGTEVVILDERDDWYQVALSDNKVGWVSSQLITTREEALARGEVPVKPASQKPTPGPSAPRPQPWQASPTIVADSSGSTFGTNLARTALGFLGRGIRYVWGGGEPGRGFDCSGFVSYVVGKFGLGLPHNAAQQYKRGSPVSSGMLRPGDLVFFQNTGRAGISHVGIYIGGGQFVHCSSSRGGMVVSTLQSGYYAHKYAGARRVR